MIPYLNDPQKEGNNVHSCKYLLLLFNKLSNVFLQLGTLGSKVDDLNFPGETTLKLLIH